MRIEVPDSVIGALREALTPVIERLVDEKVEQRRPLLLSVTQVAEELSCSRASVYGLIRGGYLEAISTGRSYRIATATLHDYVEELSKPRHERSVVSGRSIRRPRQEPKVAATNRNRSRQGPLPSAVTATKPPRSPRPQKPKVSKQDVAERRCTIAEFGEQWWGMDSATALIERSGVPLTEDAKGQVTFRYGDLVSWMEGHTAQFEQWLEEFDPVLKRSVPATPPDARNET